jgi:hypothetical protein
VRGVRVGGSGEVAHRIESQWVGESILCVTQLCRAVHFENGGGDRGGDGRKGCWEEQCVRGVESTAPFAKPPNRKINYLPRHPTESVTARR